MSKVWKDEAIVLRTYNVGETDRFCILLTKHHGRVAARAPGARRLLSRRAGGLLPLHRVNVTCDTHSSGTMITAAECIEPHRLSWCDPHAFSCTGQGIELLLKLTEDGDPMPHLFVLTCDFVAACALPHPEQLPSLFSLKLLTMFGLCPSLTHSSASHAPLTTPAVFSHRSGGLALKSEDPSGRRISAELLDILKKAGTLPFTDLPLFSPELLSELRTFTQLIT